MKRAGWMWIGVRLGAALALAGVGSVACGPVEAPKPEPPQWTPALEEEARRLEDALASPVDAGEGLRVQLAAPEAADLDLYVTDPLEESVYYANTPSRAGGSLVEDRRCEHAPPRVETVRFDAPPPGRYRVGVDYPHRCREDAGVVAFVVAIDAAGRRQLGRGLAVPGVFEPIVVEFVLDRDPDSEGGEPRP